MEHIGYIIIGGKAFAYFGTAYVDKGGFNDISLEFFHAILAEDGEQGREIRSGQAGSEHHRQVTFVEQLLYCMPTLQFIEGVCSNEPVQLRIRA